MAALVAAELAGLTEDEAVAAMGIGLSGASGVFEFLTNGASVKSLHPGLAAQAGLNAADLARAGLTGPETAFEGRCGLFSAFAGDARLAGAFAAALDGLGTEWHLPQAAFKFHPCCHYLHPFIEAAGILADRGVKPDDVAALTCRVPAGAAPIICEPWDAKQAPASGHAARWSLPVAVAARLVEGKVDLATFEAPAGAAVLALAGRIAWEPLADARFPQVFEAEIVAETRDGARHEIRVDDVYGNAGRPAGDDAVREKFRRNAARSLAPDGIASLEAAIDALADARASTPSPCPCPTPSGATHEHGTRPPHPRRRRRPVGARAHRVRHRRPRRPHRRDPRPRRAGFGRDHARRRGLVVLPGAIDVHLHLGHGRDIARPRVPADAAQESAAAAVGGITCFIPYLMTSDPFASVLPEVIGITEAGSRIDFGYHPIISTEAQLAEVEACARDHGAPTSRSS